MRGFDELNPGEQSRFAERLRGGVVPPIPSPSDPEDGRRVLLMVTGGAPGDRYEYRAEVTSAGHGNVSVLDEIQGFREEDSAVVIEPDQVQDLFARAAAEEVLNIDHPTPQFVPDSLVGTLVVTDGVVEKRIQFAVDSQSGRAREPGEADIALSPASGLVIRQEYATPGVRALVEAFQSIPGLMR